MAGPTLSSILSGEEDPIEKRGTFLPFVERKSGKAEIGLPEFLHSPWEALKGLNTYQPGTQDEQAVKNAANVAGAVTMGGLGLNWTGAVPKGALGSAGAKAPQQGITAYHGSPHDFDRFDMSKIGTGEGAQAYGHGLYFAENEGVARYYKRHEKGKGDKTVNGEQFDYTNPSHLAADYVDAWGPEALSHIRRDLATRNDHTRARYETAARMIEQDAASIPSVDGPARMYEVRIKADPESFLDWDAPLSKQSEAVQRALNVKAADASDLRSRKQTMLAQKSMTREEADELGRINDALDKLDPNASTMFRSLESGGGIEASQKLRDAGIPGIKYLDQGSRSGGEGTRNFVVFDADKIEILKKYGWVPAGIVGGGMMMTPPDGDTGGPTMSDLLKSR